MVAGVFLRPLLPIDETRYLSVAWEMHQSHDFLVPHKNGAIYTHKPPLLFWLINLVWAISGTGGLLAEALARLVAPAFGVASLFATAWLARILWPQDGARIGWRAGAILAGFSVFALYSGLVMFDTMLTLATLLGLGALVRALRGEGTRYWIGFGLALGFGVYAKGPVILLHLLPALLFYRLWLPAPRPAPARVLGWGGGAILIALGLVALWVVPAAIIGGPEYRTAILWTQSAGRVANSFAHARPWWMFLAFAPVLFFPWIWLPAAWRGLARANWHDAGLRLCAVWFGAALVLFSMVSGKQAHYLLPEYPALALMLARSLPATLGAGAKRPARKGRLSRWGMLGPVLPVLALGGLALAIGLGMGPATGLGAALRPHAAPLAIGGIAFVLAALALWRASLGALIVLGVSVVFLANALIGTTGLYRMYDTHVIARLIAPHDKDGIAVIDMPYHAEFGFVGRLTRPVAVLKSADLPAWIASHPAGVMIGRPGKADAPADANPDWTPRRRINYMDKPYLIWFVADKPK